MRKAGTKGEREEGMTQLCDCAIRDRQKKHDLFYCHFFGRRRSHGAEWEEGKGGWSGGATAAAVSPKLDITAPQR